MTAFVVAAFVLSVTANAISVGTLWWLWTILREGERR